MASHYIRMASDGTALGHVAASVLPFEDDGTPRFLTSPKGDKQWFLPAAMIAAAVTANQRRTGPFYEDLDKAEGTIRYGAENRPYRERRKAAYADQLGKDKGDVINTMGDVLDIVIAQVEAMRVEAGVQATGEYAAMLAKIAAIKAANPKA